MVIFTEAAVFVLETICPLVTAIKTGFFILTDEQCVNQKTSIPLICRVQREWHLPKRSKLTLSMPTIG